MVYFRTVFGSPVIAAHSPNLTAELGAEKDGPMRSISPSRRKSLI